MKFVLFYHSLVSDWNHGNAHFLRGMVRALSARGHHLAVYEPRNGWSRRNLMAEDPQAITAFTTAFPTLSSTLYDPATLDLDRALDGADVVLVHEWNEPELIARLNRRRACGGRIRLLFHDTHHRSVTSPEEIDRLELDAFDGVLAFGDAVRERYLSRGWSRNAWTWHEAADDTLFHPLATGLIEDDLVWIGNWGDDERVRELNEFVVQPVRDLRLRAAAHGVRYPVDAVEALAAAGIEYRGWLPNHEVPRVFARSTLTVHVPRRPYAAALPGIPTIRVFEALACGIPLISAPWTDSESLFGEDDFLVARDGTEMQSHLRALLADRDLRATIAANGLGTVLSRHTCHHRCDELLDICGRLNAGGMAETGTALGAEVAQ